MPELLNFLLPLLVPAVAVIGGIFAYFFNKNADRKMDIKKQRTEIYIRFLIHLNENSSSGHISSNILMELSVLAPIDIVETAVRLFDVGRSCTSNREKKLAQISRELVILMRKDIGWRDDKSLEELHQILPFNPK